MKSVMFRSIDEWNSALLMLPENSFFMLMRSVLGNIKTPFNKQTLIHDLTAFLSKKEIQETIKRYIDEDDHRVIAAIGVLDEPLSGELESFFSGEYSYAGLHNIVLNLEERLIVYRFKEEGKFRLALNPVLAPVLKPFIENVEVLFPSSEIIGSVKPAGKKSSWGSSLLACFISFLYDQHDLFKNQGGIRKKSLDDFKQVFPGLELKPILGTFRAAGLMQLDEQGKHHLDEVRLNQLSELSEYERQVYLASAMIVFYEQGENFWQYFNRTHLLNTAKTLHQFLQNLNAARSYPESTMHKIFEIQEKKGKDIFFKKTAEKNKGRIELVLSVLNKAGLIEEVKNDCMRGVHTFYPLSRASLGALKKGMYLETNTLPKTTSPAACGGVVDFRKTALANHHTEEKHTQSKLISMDSPNSFIVFPEITFSDAVKLSRFSSVLETGTATRFTITKDSVVRAFMLGIKCDEIILTLKNLSGTGVDQNVVWQLKDWEKRYAEVSLHTGVVLSLSKDRLYLTNTEPLASMISLVLAPGVFLLSIDEEDAAANALKKAGVDIIARNAARQNIKHTASEKRQIFFPALDAMSKHQVLHMQEKMHDDQSDNFISDEGKSDAQKDHFRTLLAKMKLSKDQRDELATRIERRLILTAEQMDGSSVKYEKLEARGLDYVGKYNIAKHALSTGALLEVVWSDNDGTIQRIFGIPSSIDKVNGEAILVLHSEENQNNQGAVIRIALGRISLLRRIKQSIFGE